ncbi:IS110 family transposase [Nostoc sp. NIES-2111]
MTTYIGCDAHRKFSVFVRVDGQGRASAPERVEHEHEAMRDYLGRLPAGSEIALEASGSWYWLVDVMEESGLSVHLANPLEAKRRMRGRNKTDALDAMGLAYLLKDGRLPEVWIPASSLLDLRGLMRTRLGLRQTQTSVKSRISSAINRYGLKQNLEMAGDLYAGKGRLQLALMIQQLPPSTRLATQAEWDWVDQCEKHIQKLEDSICRQLHEDVNTKLLKSIPGVGRILSATILLEVGQAERFPSAGHLASYAGLVPRVFASGGKTRHGSTPQDCNHYLKWAFIEAANCTVWNSRKYKDHHVGQLYAKVRSRSNHGKAAVAVARHLAEASWHILSKQQLYREPAPLAVSSSANGSAR